MGNTTGFKAMSITKLSAIFDNVDVREIGLMSLLKSQIDDVFGKGWTSASFHTDGTLHSENEVFKMSVMGLAMMSEKVLSTQFGRLSGPHMLVLTYACEVFNFNLQEKLKESLERVQKRAMRIIHGFDTPYEVALDLSSLEWLSSHRENLCDDFLLKISGNIKDKLFKYLPFNTNTVLPLRNIRKFSVPKCNTDRFKNSFIDVASSRYNEFYCKK